MTNFDFLKNDPNFESFAEVAILAEQEFCYGDYDACVINCRRALEFAVKWMYSFDEGLRQPYSDNLATLIATPDFREIVPEELLREIHFIRKRGNDTVHIKKTSEGVAGVCLQNLFSFMDFLEYVYSDAYTEKSFNKDLLKPLAREETAPDVAGKDFDYEQLARENAELREQLTNRREERSTSYEAPSTNQPVKDISELKTRKIYIDTMLTDAGWVENHDYTVNKDWTNEVELEGMPNKGNVGFADYVLYGEDGNALALIEAKRTSVNVEKGRQQAKLYADLLEKKNKNGRRPVIFLSNGYETRIIDGQYPERPVAAIYSRRDLEKLFNLRAERRSLTNVKINDYIAGRYYQKQAIESVCTAFDEENRRKALLVMATGSGKTRTVIALVDVLLHYGWVKNVLFLADRTALVTQAKRSFVNLPVEITVSNLCEKDCDYDADCLFSTYQTMYNLIDDAKDDQGRVFTPGHFDLIICDEAHRSIYNKYQDIFNYFDAPLVGLTATPKDEIDKNTYEIFELESGVPTYGYELAQAVKDGYLVNYSSVETKTKFLSEGISYDDLSEEEKKEYEDTFTDEDGNLPESISPSALNEWVFNKDTIKEVLHVLMTEGLRINYGETLGKTIIFAKNHEHAEKILEVFHKEYPALPDYAKVIDNHINYAQSAIDEFSDPKKMPQIAISVDMLDTGIDVPEILNLVMFKKVLSKAKFWQMIGRGTRLCPGLIDGNDKKRFLIFDFCGNFEFFRLHSGDPSVVQKTLQGAIYTLKFEIAYKLQKIEYQTDDLKAFRKRLVNDMTAKVRELNRKNFAVRQHIKYVNLYSDPENYNTITYPDVMTIADEIAPLLLPDDDEPSAIRFDALMHGIELAYLVGEKHRRARKDLLKRVKGLSEIANIPEITIHSELIEKIIHTDYIENGTINDFEHIREELRDLMKYLPSSFQSYTTDFDDNILSTEWHDADLESDDLKNYKRKAEYYIREHQDHIAIAKLKANKPLTKTDMAELEKILWNDLGSKNDYTMEFGNKPLGEFVREIVGLDMKAAKEAFSKFLSDTRLNSHQIYFVNQIVEYIVHNGLMKDLSVLQESPFTDQGSVVELFSDRNLWADLRKTIDQVNANAIA